MTTASSTQLNKFSSRITQPKSQGASQAMLYATGLSEADMDKAQVGISSCWFEGNSCNMHLDDLAARVKDGVRHAGLVGFRFNTIGVSDGISMGTDGMSYSLQSRDLIADSIETVMSAQWYDANISIPGCDKNMPGCVMAMGRLNRPSLMIYGGTIRPGQGSSGDVIDIASASVRRPALRSASMAICLPGMASRVNLAATSETRDEPFVMTTNWMMTRIMNTISPTTSEPPTTD